MSRQISIAVMSFIVAGGLFTSTSYGRVDGNLIAQDEHVNNGAISQTSGAESTNKAEIVGNKTCPVSGEKIDKKTEVTYEYKGKIYSFCCQGCIDEFKKDPEKYIEQMEKGKDMSPHEESRHGEH